MTIPPASFKVIFFSLMFLAVALEVAADILFRYWSLNGSKLLFVIGLVIYLTGTAFWAYSLKYELLSRAASVFAIINLILLVLAGAVIFKEDLSLINKIGIGLGIISLLLIEL